jgi:hypothetical protein
MQLPQLAASGPSTKPDRLRRREKVALDGTAVVQVGAPAGNEYWFVDRVVVQAPAAPAGTCTAYMYVGAVQSSDLVDVSADASFDVAENAVAVLVDNADLIVVFAGAPAGSDVYVSAQITRVRTS